MSNYTKQAIQAFLVVLLGDAIGLSVMAAFYWANNDCDLSRLKQQYPITKYNDLRKPRSNIPSDRPPCTNIDTCR